MSKQRQKTRELQRVVSHIKESALGQGGRRSYPEGSERGCPLIWVSTKRGCLFCSRWADEQG